MHDWDPLPELYVPVEQSVHEYVPLAMKVPGVQATQADDDTDDQDPGEHEEQADAPAAENVFNPQDRH